MLGLLCGLQGGDCGFEMCDLEGQGLELGLLELDGFVACTCISIPVLLTIINTTVR